MPYDLVIFDCDGVLVDSERLTNTVFAQMLNELGLEVTLSDMFDKFVGQSMAQSLRQIEEMLGCSPPPDFARDYTSRCGKVLKSDIKAVEGVRQVIEALDVPYCVASSGEIEKMNLTLGATGLLPLFRGKMFSVVAEGTLPKPNPDIFLLAAERMGAIPPRCVVIEDTPIGTSAGVAAGMTVFGYCELMSSTRLKEAGAAETFKRMSELPTLLKS